MCEAKERERERESERDEKTKKENRRERERERSEKRDVHPSPVFCSHQKLVCEYSLLKKMEKITPSLSSHKIKKKRTHTHTSREGRRILSLPRHFKSYIYARIKKTAYIKNGFDCASEKSLLVSHFLICGERIERSRVFARGGFPIGFFCFVSLFF